MSGHSQASAAVPEPQNQAEHEAFEALQADVDMESQRQGSQRVMGGWGVLIFHCPSGRSLRVVTFVFIVSRVIVAAGTWMFIRRLWIQIGLKVGLKTTMVVGLSSGDPRNCVVGCQSFCAQFTFELRPSLPVSAGCIKYPC